MFFASVSYGENDIAVLKDNEVVTGVPDDDFLHEETNSERFIPTHEWQVIKEGQSIPAGLHVRMNFQTGIKEAKIMESSENQNTKFTTKKETLPAKENTKGPKIILANDGIKDQLFSNEKLHFKKSQLKQALHDFKDKIGTKDIEHVTWSDDAKDILKETMGQEQSK